MKCKISMNDSNYCEFDLCCFYCEHFEDCSSEEKCGIFDSKEELIKYGCEDLVRGGENDK